MSTEQTTPPSEKDMLLNELDEKFAALRAFTGPLGPVAAFLVQRVATVAVRSHRGSVADKMLDLDGRREVNASLSA